MWSQVINVFNPYYATLESIYKEQQEKCQEDQSESSDD